MYANKVICIHPQNSWQFFSLVRTDRFCIHPQNCQQRNLCKKSQSNRLKPYPKEHLDSLQIQGNWFPRILSSVKLFKSTWGSKTKWCSLSYQTLVKFWEFLKPPNLVVVILYQPCVKLSTLNSLYNWNFSTFISCSNEKSFNMKVVEN